MGKAARDNRPRLRPVQKIELSEKHLGLRAVLAIVFLAIGLAALGWGLYAVLRTEAGWTVIESDNAGIDGSEEIQFTYFIGQADKSRTAEKKELVALYTEEVGRINRLLSIYENTTGLHNLYYINHHVGEEIVVDEALYEAFEQIERADSRVLFAAPYYPSYRDLCFSDNEPTASLFDPYRDAETAAYFRALADFVTSEEAVRLELLGNCTVRLHVSEAYQAFATQHEIDAYIDFNRYKNAFVVDHLASVLTEAGKTLGYLSSYDGFTRNLDRSGNSYSLNLFDKEGTAIYPVSTLTYEGPMSLVYVRTYPMAQKDTDYFFVYEDGTATTPYVAPNGEWKAATDSYVSYSSERTCAEILLATLPAVLADEFDASIFREAKEDGIYSVWYGVATLYYNDASVTLSPLYETEDVRYQKFLVED